MRTKKPAEGTLSLEGLTKLFAALGARSPGDWARSQIEERIPQLARFLFLRQAWQLVISEDDTNWIAQLRSEAKRLPGHPGAAGGAALDRLLAHGASPEDLAKVVRVMQWRTLAGLCYLLDDPGTLESEVEGVAWRLFEVDEDDQPIAPMTGLHESVLETDPTGREMRPSDADKTS